MQAIEIQDKREPGWFWADNRIIGSYGEQLGPYGIAVYMCLAYHANNGREAWPSLATIAKEVGISKRKAAMMIGQLETLQLITVLNRTLPSGDATSNLYTLQPIKCKDALAGNASSAIGIAPHAIPPMASRAIGIAPHAHEQDPVNKTQLEQESSSLPPKKRRKSSPDSPEQREQVERQKAIIAAYREVLVYPIVNEAQEGVAAKKLAQLNYQPAQVIACYQAMKAEDFWKGKHLALASVAKQIGAYLSRDGAGPGEVIGKTTIQMIHSDGIIQPVETTTRANR